MTEQKLIELRMLNLLRDRDYFFEWSPKVRPKHLSPIGVMIYKTIKNRLTKERKRDIIALKGISNANEEEGIKDYQSFILPLRDIALLLRKEYPRHDLKSCKELLLDMKEYDRDFVNPGTVRDLFETAMNRAVLREVSALAANQLDSGKIDIEAVKEAVAPLSDGDTTVPIEPADFLNLVEEINRDRIPTGFERMDRELQGGLGRAELAIVAGSPKRGKTSMMVNIAVHEMKNASRPVLHFSLADLSKAEVVIRYACVIGGKREEEMLARKDWLKVIQDWQERNKNWVIPIDLNYRKVTPSEIEDVIRRVKSIYGELRLVIVDRAESMASAAKDGGLRHSLAAVYEDLRRVAAATNTSILTDTQGSEQSYTRRRVTMDLARESKVDKASILDIWIGLGRDPEDKTQRYVTLQGRRRIENDMLLFSFDKDNFRFQEEAFEGDDND